MRVTGVTRWMYWDVGQEQDKAEAEEGCVQTIEVSTHLQQR